MRYRARLHIYKHIDIAFDELLRHLPVYHEECICVVNGRGSSFRRVLLSSDEYEKFTRREKRDASHLFSPPLQRISLYIKFNVKRLRDYLWLLCRLLVIINLCCLALKNYIIVLLI